MSKERGFKAACKIIDKGIDWNCSMKTYLVLFVVSGFLTFNLTSFLDLLSKKLKIFVLDYPDGNRKIHAGPLPQLGGLALVLSFVLSICLLLVRQNILSQALKLHLDDVIYIIVPSFFVFLLGFYDDLKGLKARDKLIFQILAALILYYLGLKITRISNPLGNPIELGYLALLATVVWLVGTTNAFNLIDGMDGLASGIAFLTSVSLFTVSLVYHSPLVSIFSIILAGSTLGFLKFNFNPAKIFLGNSGSYFLGFILGALAIKGLQKSSLVVSFVIPIFLFALPFTDAALAVMRRLSRGRSIFSADKEHIHHKLLNLLRSQRLVALLLYGAAALFGILSFLGILLLQK